MKLNINYLFIVTLFSIITLTSCAPSTQYTEIIENNSDYDLEIVYTYGLVNDTNSYQDTVLITSKTEKAINGITKRGKLDEFSDCESSFKSNELTVSNSDSLVVSKQLDNNNDWEFIIDKERTNGGGICECRLVIDNNHIK